MHEFEQRDQLILVLLTNPLGPMESRSRRLSV